MHHCENTDSCIPYAKWLNDSWFIHFIKFDFFSGPRAWGVKSYESHPNIWALKWTFFGLWTFVWASMFIFPARPRIRPCIATSFELCFQYDVMWSRGCHGRDGAMPRHDRNMRQNGFASLGSTLNILNLISDYLYHIYIIIHSTV